jgi:hypothetical protein
VVAENAYFLEYALWGLKPSPSLSSTPVLRPSGKDFFGTAADHNVQILKRPDYVSYVSAACLVSLSATTSERMTDTASEALNPRYAAVYFRVAYCIHHMASAMFASTIK